VDFGPSQQQEIWVLRFGVQIPELLTQRKFQQSATPTLTLEIWRADSQLLTQRKFVSAQCHAHSDKPPKTVAPTVLVLEFHKPPKTVAPTVLMLE